jgi:hypothetical protein
VSKSNSANKEKVKVAEQAAEQRQSIEKAKAVANAEAADRGYSTAIPGALAPAEEETATCPSAPDVTEEGTDNPSSESLFHPPEETHFSPRSPILAKMKSAAILREGCVDKSVETSATVPAGLAMTTWQGVPESKVGLPKRDTLFSGVDSGSLTSTEPLGKDNDEMKMTCDWQ